MQLRPPPILRIKCDSKDSGLGSVVRCCMSLSGTSLCIIAEIRIAGLDSGMNCRTGGEQVDRPEPKDDIVGSKGSPSS